MNHGILITAYKDYAQLVNLVDAFDESSFLVFIHVDKKSSFSTDQLALLAAKPRVHCVLQEYSVNWASFAHLEAIIMLCRVAIECPQLSYLHLVSGQDYLIRPLPSLLKFFSENRGVNFLDFNKLPNSKWAGGGFNRVHSYHGYDFIDAKSRVGHLLLLALHTVTKLKLFRRKYNDDLPPLFGGSTWWSLTRECIQYVVHATDDDPYFLNRLRYSFCPEELFFQTTILNSPFRNQVRNVCL